MGAKLLLRRPDYNSGGGGKNFAIVYAPSLGQLNQQCHDTLDQYTASVKQAVQENVEAAKDGYEAVKTLFEWFETATTPNCWSIGGGKVADVRSGRYGLPLPDVLRLES